MKETELTEGQPTKKGQHSYTWVIVAVCFAMIFITLGICTSVGMVGFATGASVLNFIYDKTGTYVPSLLVCAGLMIAVTVAMWLVTGKANKIKKQVLAQQAQSTCTTEKTELATAEKEEVR